jgi:hypothetical protein
MKMQTDALIKAIAEDACTRSLAPGLHLAIAVAAGGLVAGTHFAQSLGMRPDIAAALQTWRFSGKMVILLACLLAALWASARLTRPDASPRRAFAALLLPAGGLALAVVLELVLSPAAAWSFRAVGTNGRLCLTSIALLSLAPLVAALLAMRAGAPRSPAAAGAGAGLLAGALAATLYASHCFDDSPLFVVLWYLPAIAAIALAGAAAGSRLLRW